MVFGFLTRKFSRLRTPSPYDKSISPPPPSLSPSPDNVVLVGPEVPVTAQDLHDHLASIPPQTLHEYTLANLRQPVPINILNALNAYFALLTPPPQLHCVRCHKGFFEVENSEYSCLVGHDDESAEVTRSKGCYESMWACCGRTVEGDGDMGPPDGWCYEGKHTTDVKRARFRADSTLTDDKLTTCTQMRCPHTRKRKREDDDDVNTNDVQSTHSRSNSWASTSASKKKLKIDDTKISDDMDVDSTTKSPPRQSPTKSKKSPTPRRKPNSTQNNKPGPSPLFASFAPTSPPGLSATFTSPGPCTMDMDTRGRTPHKSSINPPSVHSSVSPSRQVATSPLRHVVPTTPPRQTASPSRQTASPTRQITASPSRRIVEVVIPPSPSRSPARSVNSVSNMRVNDVSIIHKNDVANTSMNDVSNVHENENDILNTHENKNDVSNMMNVDAPDKPETVSSPSPSPHTITRSSKEGGSTRMSKEEGPTKTSKEGPTRMSKEEQGPTKMSKEDGTTKTSLKRGMRGKGKEPTPSLKGKESMPSLNERESMPSMKAKAKASSAPNSIAFAPNHSITYMPTHSIPFTPDRGGRHTPLTFSLACPERE